MKKDSEQRQRIRQVPRVFVQCVLCVAFEGVKSLQKLCSWIDHDLRGHICDDCAPLVCSAEEKLSGIGCAAATTSLMEDHS
jgi:hypothetical protein